MVEKLDFLAISMDSEEDIVNLIQHLETAKVRKLVAAGESNFLHLNLLNALASDEQMLRIPATDRERKDMAYVLVNYEKTHRSHEPLDLEEALNSSLKLAVECQDIVVCDVLLQSGADVFCPIIGSNQTLYDQIMNGLNQELRDSVDKYFPGVWNAVEGENISEVRRLVNYWCSTDIYQGGVSLMDITLQTGHEAIIRLLTGVHHTMKLVEAVLAGNAKSTKELLTNHRKEIHVDFKNMSESGSPLLYYAIRRNDIDITKILIESGCKLFTLMRTGDEMYSEIPVFFAALCDPKLPPEMMEALLPKNKARQEEILYRMIFQGQSALQLALRRNLNLKAFEILVNRCGAKLLADRNEACQTIRDLAVGADLHDFVDIIDSYVENCLKFPQKYPYQRQILALWGYDFSYLTDKTGHFSKNFLHHLPDYQRQVKQLSVAIEEGDLELFRSLTHWKNPDGEALFETLLCWDGRCGQNDPLPMIHKAVIFNRPQIVSLILKLKPRGHSIDTLFDQHRRTALHYAFALREFSDIRVMLREQGSSEHSLDRAQREPLDFRDFQDKPLMRQLIDRFRFGSYADLEPNVWDAGWAEEAEEDKGYDKENENEEGAEEEQEDNGYFSCSIC